MVKNAVQEGVELKGWEMNGIRMYDVRSTKNQYVVCLFGFFVCFFLSYSRTSSVFEIMYSTCGQRRFWRDVVVTLTD